MGLKFLCGEIAALLAWICVIFSYWKNKDRKILFFNILSVVFFSLSYFLFGAYTAIYVCIFEIIRDWLYMKTNALKVFICTIPVYLIALF